MRPAVEAGAREGDVALEQLANGVRVLTLMGRAGSMVAMVFVGAGSRLESRQSAGAAHFLEHLFFKGTANRPSTRQIAIEIDSLGCRSNAFTNKEYTGYYIKGAAEYAPEASEILSDLVANALLPADEIEREREVIVSEQRLHEDNPQSVVRMLANRALYGDTPMGWDVTGLTSAIRGISREEIVSFRQRFYAPSRMTFVLAGSVTPEQHRSLAAEHFAGLPPAQPPVPAPAGYGPLQNLSLHRQLKQANLCFALPGPSYADPERTMATVRLLHVILGGAMSSRLFLRVRERMGLCYLIRSLIEPGADVGSILVLTATEPSQAPRLTEAILAEIHRLRREGVQRQELETARAILKGLWVLEREDSGNWARLSAFELLQLGRVRSREEHFATLDSITAGEVWAAADRYLGADGMRCALVGPAEVERSLDRSGLLPAGRWNTIEDLGSA